MSYLTFVVIVVPAIIGIAAAIHFGPNRGVMLGGVVAMVAVYILLFFQITLPDTTPGDAGSRFSSAGGLFRFEWYRWVPSFLAGAAIGSLIFRVRNKA